MAHNGSGRSNERICRISSLALTACVIYGSLVPFDLRAPHVFSPGSGFGQIRFTPWRDASPSDSLINLVLGVPLGFFVMGSLDGAHRRTTLRIARAAAAIGSVSILGTTVELIQVLSPVRQSSWNDVLAQNTGAALGVLAWTLVGSPVLSWFRQLPAERHVSRFIARLLVIYLPFYLVIQLTPTAVSFTESAAEAGLVVVPTGSSLGSLGLVLCNFGGSALLNVPIGALASLSSPSSVSRAFGVGLSALGLVALVQSSLSWRHVTFSEVLAGATGVAAGVATAASSRVRWFRIAAITGRTVNLRILMAAGWILVLVAHSWTNDRAVIIEKPDLRSTRMSLLSFYLFYSAQPWAALHEGLLKFLLPVPYGLLLGMSSGGIVRRCREPGAALGLIAGLAVLLSAIELWPSSLPIRFPDLTNVLIGTGGGLIGVAIGQALFTRMASANRWNRV